jgi:uridylate kinase
MAQGRVVFLKQSGERLTSDGRGWDADSVRAISSNIARVALKQKENGIDGIVLVPGAGNVIRGDIFKTYGIAPQRADMLGRLATVINAVIIAEDLQAMDVPTKVFIAQSMAYRDGQYELEPYSAEELHQTLGEGQIAIIAGGRGEDNATTDYAVAYYAGDYRRQYPETEVTVLKGTKWDGVFENDPAKAADVRRYRVIGAPMMQRDYERFSAVDRRSLEQIISNGLKMLVYADNKHPLETVLGENPTDDGIGTLIMPQDIEPVPY